MSGLREAAKAAGLAAADPARGGLVVLRHAPVRGYAQDVSKLNPVHVVIIAGVLGAAAFVLALVLLVRWVVGSGVAA
jgi:hypothetical protein